MRVHPFERRTSVAFAAMSFAAVLAAAAPALAQDGDRIPNRRFRQGLEIAPVPLDFAGRSRNLVGLGSYVVNALGGCNDCHTNPSYAEGGDPFLGQPEIINADRYLAGGRSFGPSLVSPNITPDENGLPGGLTEEAFVEVMRTGRDSDDGHILQVMPWPVYANMTDHDLRAVYAFLSSIPSLPDESPMNE
jgi:hypothetical protein